jgi:hypothetical protein
MKNIVKKFVIKKEMTLIGILGSILITTNVLAAPEVNTSEGYIKNYLQIFKDYLPIISAVLSWVITEIFDSFAPSPSPLPQRLLKWAGHNIFIYLWFWNICIVLEGPWDISSISSSSNFLYAVLIYMSWVVYLIKTGSIKITPKNNI